MKQVINFILLILTVAFFNFRSCFALAQSMQEGEFEIKYSFRQSTPNWTLDGFLNLPHVWNRPDILPGSSEFYKELFVRYGVFRKEQSELKNIPEDILPTGLVITEQKINGKTGIQVTCLICHSTVAMGQKVTGIGNPFFNGAYLYRDLTVADGQSGINHSLPYVFTPAKASMVNAADHIGVLGLYVRNPDMTINLYRALKIKTGTAWDLYKKLDQTPYLKTPSWLNFNLKYQASEAVEGNSRSYGFYMDGGLSRNAIFADFAYMAAFDLSLEGVVNASSLRKARRDWKEHAPYFLRSPEAPSYPLPINHEAARAGLKIFSRTCSRCHGDYQIDNFNNSILTGFKQRIVPWKLIQTDQKRILFSDVIRGDVNRVLGKISNGPQMIFTGGYVVQPLTAITFRYPFLHNGSIPNLRTLLTPAANRPKKWMFDGYPGSAKSYDQVNGGLKIRILTGDEKKDEFARLFVENPGLGLSTSGHEFGTTLGDLEKTNLIEFLKTL